MSCPSNNQKRLAVLPITPQLVMKQMTCMHQELYTDDDALRWSSQVAGALAYLHSSRPQVIHRDLKLENVLLKGTKDKADRCAQTAKLAVRQCLPFWRGFRACLLKGHQIVQIALEWADVCSWAHTL